MNCRKFLILSVLMALAGCQPSAESTVKNEQSTSETGQLEKPAGGHDDTSDEPVEVGMFRWSSGMQMGTYWAAVGNKNGDYLRFFSEDGKNWEPSIELASTEGIGSEGILNIVVRDKAEVFPYELVDGQPEILFLGMDGANSKVRLVEHLRSADAPICVEFPEAGRRTCFSIAGVSDAFS